MRHELAAVLFADLVDYTDLSERSPEDALALVHRFQEAAREVVERLDGRIVKFMGDGAMAEFRSSRAAVAAADDLRRELRLRAVEAGLAPPRLRIGVHLGEVAVSEDGDLYGEGVNVAARIQAAAEPDQLLVSE